MTPGGQFIRLKNTDHAFLGALFDARLLFHGCLDDLTHLFVDPLGFDAE